METKLARIAEITKVKPKEVFTSLYHYLNEAMLIQCHNELSADKAAGVDEVTKEEYAKDLKGNIKSLVERLKKHSYKPQPVRRVYIPKDNGKERPLGIPAYEDKIVQLGLKKILERIYETDFLDNSYGFRPERSCHDAVIELDKRIMGKTNYIVDADIKGFFDNVSHEWIIKFIGVRVADPNIKKLITKFLKAGVMEEGNIEPSEAGTPQGGVISPLLANIYLHYALDLWFEKAVKPRLKGEANLIRFADDFVCCFQYKEEAKQFYAALKERLAKFELEIAENKSKIIEFGRFAAGNRQAKGLGKPETFDFLGFTHYCSQTRNGKFTVKRKTSKKKFKAKVKAFATWIKRVRDQENIRAIFETVKAKLQGHYNYYGISDNYQMIAKYYNGVIDLIFKWLNRRSQRESFSWDKFNLYLKQNPLPRPKIKRNLWVTGKKSL
jgi:Retron-type reverse transcriptase